MNGFGYRDEHRPIFVVALLLACVLAIGCASGTVQTAYGPRPAAEVQAQDAVADVIKTLEDGYVAAVRLHDARVMTENPLDHAAHRALLIKEHDALVAAATALVQWKQTAGSNWTPAGVIQPLVDSLPAYLKLAVSLGALTQEKADQVQAFVSALFPPRVALAGPVFYPIGGLR